MDTSLKKLIELMPPPKKARGKKTDWERLESALGLTYPKAFKEYVAVYGGSVWFDNLSPYYSEAKSTREIKVFIRHLQKRLKDLNGNMYDNNWQEVDLPLWPNVGGLFPFMIDYSGCQYLWATKSGDPEKWPVVLWQTGAIINLGRITLAQMILGWLQRTPRMRKVWGDINDFEPSRIRVE